MTRDNVIWWIGIIVAVAGGIATLDTKTATETFGIPGGLLPYIRLISFVVGIVSGKLSMSPLPLSPDGQLAAKAGKL